jgi:hypothetical protein
MLALWIFLNLLFSSLFSLDKICIAFFFKLSLLVWLLFRDLFLLGILLVWEEIRFSIVCALDGVRCLSSLYVLLWSASNMHFSLLCFFYVVLSSFFLSAAWLFVLSLLGLLV